jgi:rSAM/selenodomain-associated transferase 2
MLSVIIPTYNEAPHILTLIASLRGHEIIVSDGGSTDETVQISRAAGAIVIESERRRGAQLNAGARAATGKALWFVHADARPHPRAATHIKQCLLRPEIVGGNFRLRFAGMGWAPHFFSRIARHQRRLGVYYGDSGIWLRRDVFETLGGFAHWPLFEDYDLARRMESFARRHALRTNYAPLPIYASSRRFENHPALVLSQWLLLQALFSLGVPPTQLANWYRKK